MAPGPYTCDLQGCARCDGAGHPGLTFTPLTYPFELEEEMPFTHWAPCPTNGEPILMRFAPVIATTEQA